MEKKNSHTQTLLIIGVVILIVLLILWLTVADFFGDTDVAASLLRHASETLASVTLS
ncbi:MAG: hypothetical protein K2L63_05645 [Paramuribaculum sp.]|nr:hypothetical protein [Paramuribaculum sp.]